jgi:uncharacterized protein
MLAPTTLLTTFFVLSLPFLFPSSIINNTAKYFLAAVIIAILFLAGVLQFIGVCFILLLLVAMLLACHKNIPFLIRAAFAVIATIGFFGFSLGLIPGFIKTLVVDKVLMGHSTQPFSMNIGYAKGVMGMLMLLVWIKAEANFSELMMKIFRSLRTMIGLVVLFLAFAATAGFSFDPKWYWFTPYFLIANLCLTVVAEEVFFRSIMQQKIMEWLTQHTKFAELIALLSVSIFFGLLHLGGGLTYAALATLAGIMYGWLYWRYQSIHSAILCHFLVNMLHFIFLQYPA